MLRMQWFKENFLKEIDTGKILTVLDVGSRCVPGQNNNYKIFFNTKYFNYIGLDMVEGYNVDIVLKKPYQWDEVQNNFCDVLICGQVFEHIEFPWITISEIARVVKPNGLICIIVPSMATLHRYPVHCQNYFSDGMIALAKYTGLEIIHATTNFAPLKASFAWYGENADTMVIAKKPNDWKENNFDKKNYICEPADLKKTAMGFVPIKEQSFIYRVKYYSLKYILIPIFKKSGMYEFIRKLLYKL
jgi:SAM-dependent methyltransferase